MFWSDYIGMKNFGRCHCLQSLFVVCSQAACISSSILSYRIDQLDVRFRVNGGPWEALDPVARSATRAYPVAESRAALVTPH